MLKDNYRDLVREHTEFFRNNKDSKCYNALCSCGGDLIKLILLELLEELGCTTPFHYSITSLYNHCAIYIKEFDCPVPADSLDNYSLTFVLTSMNFTKEDVAVCIENTNALIQYINTIFEKHHIPLLEEI